MAQRSRNPLAIQQTQEVLVRNLHGEYLLEEEMATAPVFSFEKNSMDREDWQATVHSLAKGQTQLSIGTGTFPF